MQVEFSTPPAPSHCEYTQMERTDPAEMHHSPPPPRHPESGPAAPSPPGPRKTNR